MESGHGHSGYTHAGHRQLCDNSEVQKRGDARGERAGSVSLTAKTWGGTYLADVWHCNCLHPRRLAVVKVILQECGVVLDARARYTIYSVLYL